MIRDITIGQYYPAHSIIHRLDPRVKLLGTLVFIVTVFFVNDLLGLALATAALGAVIWLSKVPLKYMLKGLRAIFILMLFTVLLNVFLTPGTEIFRWGFLKVTWEGLFLAGKTAIRLMYLIIGSTIMTLTTTPNHLTDGLEKALSPLKKLHFPVHELSMTMSIALRFIPILLEETDKIMKAQQARCADFESGHLIQRMKSLIPILVPLFISAIRRANDLAMAMEARCYHGGAGRTKMKPLVYQKRDVVAYIIILVYILIWAAVKIWL
ncbi:MAG: energy-coupling factor transporter transmembrane protein EcfT [Clostridia bacterium]|nr:energy-coupling factor transporter transmembrane component T [Lachnospiraceae bacterium]NCC00535.1 energy-coupling factor transporter transmembrane protein EcfT [Clostridia bacterium]NCD02544.1 energy-coupling factor transporter transmembrane protein EcfT [Clostridia bacterium]